MNNPLLSPSTLPYQLPPFAEIKEKHFLPAFHKALQLHDAEIAAIVDNPADPTWENTVEALESSGQDLERVIAVFANLSGTDITDGMEAIGSQLWPELSAHQDAIYQNAVLYARLKEVGVDTPKDEESQRLYAHLLRTFARKGADLDSASKARLSEINQRLSTLSEEFGRTLMESTRKLAVELTEQELEGLPEERKASASADAKALGREGFVIPLELPTVQSEQARLVQPEARAKLYEASARRGEGNAEGLIEAVQLRAERAELLGFASHADYVISEETAGNAQAARDMLFQLAPAAEANAEGEQKLLAEAASLRDEDFSAADWPYWESQVRARDFALDEEELRNYFPLEQVLEEGVFAAANRLYGIVVVPRDDLEGYAEGVRVWEVFDEGQDPATDKDNGIGLFVTDYFGRPTKRGGAWMSEFVGQAGLLERKPVIVNVMGITKPADGSQPLLSLDELRTVFHEFGHALHGLLSDVRYPTFAGTNVPRDWVEFPSQINENWALEPALVKRYARHVDTGEVIPDALLQAVSEASEFGQGFATVEYLAASIVDLAWHSLSFDETADLKAAEVAQFEKQALAKAGLNNPLIAPRYRSQYFNHIFAGGYSAGYYSYLWAEVLDADGFSWFKEEGAGDSDEQARAAGEKFRKLILSKGASRDFTETYRELRGRDKDVEPLLKRRGLAGA